MEEPRQRVLRPQFGRMGLAVPSAGKASPGQGTARPLRRVRAGRGWVTQPGGISIGVTGRQGRFGDLIARMLENLRYGR
jgi:hypothetical protein